MQQEMIHNASILSVIGIQDRNQFLCPGIEFNLFNKVVLEIVIITLLINTRTAKQDAFVLFMQKALRNIAAPYICHPAKH